MMVTLKNKVIGLPVVAAIVPVLVIFVLTYMAKGGVTKNIEDELAALARQNIARIAHAVYNTCAATSKMIEKDLDRQLRDAAGFLEGMGGLVLSSDTVSMNAVNQVTLKKETVTLPKMLIYGMMDPSTYMGVMKEKFGGDYGIFQRMNEKGDMLLVATTMAASKTHPAEGTYIPGVHDGIKNPIIASILNKKIYNGLAYIVNGWHFSACSAITDREGKIIGMLYTGPMYKTPQSLRQAIIDMKVGKTGYAYALGGKYPFHRGHYIISKGGQRDGEDLWDSKDAEGRRYVQDIVNKAIKLKRNEVAYERYPWQNPGEEGPRMKVVALTYFEPWDWVIGASVYEDDYYEARQKVADSMSQLLRVMVVSGLAVLIPVIGIGIFLGNRVTRPITKITGVVKEIATGDLSSAGVSARTLMDAGRKDDPGRMKDETENLISSVMTMTENLNSLVGQVQKSGIQISSSSTELAATAREQETTMANQVESTDRMVKAVEEISTVAEGLVATMREVAARSQETAVFASSGQNDLSRMEEAMTNMETASSSISGRLQTINEKAENITHVVVTITKVAEQTNLLSLNAAIEAEKAGEYGRGFNVVAREIRRLADQTAVATLDIEQMVKDMHGAVSAGVMEMDKFISEVKRSSEDVGKISAQLARIIEQVQILSPSFENVNIAMVQQSEGAQKINRSMAALSEEMKETKSSVHETYSAIGQLNDAARGLHDEVSRFKVS